MTRLDPLTNRRIDSTSRRTFVKLAAGTVGTAGLSAAAGAQQGAAVTTYELDGVIGYWEGVSPESIAGEENPTLTFEPGTRYCVRWTNVDGLDHNFVIIDAAGDEVVRSPITSEAGRTQTVRFRATEDMTEYFCEVHPNSMRGDVEIAGRPAPPEVPEPQIPTGATVGLTPVAEGLTAPLAFATAEEDADRGFVADQTGQIYVLEEGRLREEPFLDISDRIVDLGVPELNGYDERGLLGLAFHPDFSNNCRFFVHYSAPRRDGTPEDYDHTEVIAEFRAIDDRRRGDPGSERAILEIPSPQMNHDGGDIAFGPDGYLYVGMGDGGAADDVGPGHVQDWYDGNRGGNGQDVTENLLGSVLRIDVDDEQDGNAYAIPDDNPLVGEEGLDEQFAWGFRNPRTMSFNDGKLFVADAGQNLYEEVSIVENGGNYGWNVREGTHCFSTENPTEPPENCPDSTLSGVRGGEPLRDPIIEYRHRRRTTAFIDGSVVAGGHVYEGDALPDLQGRYVFGNWSGQGVVEPDGELFVATPPEGSDWRDGSADDGQLWSMEELVVGGTADGQLNRYVMGFGRGPGEELYVLTTERFTPTGNTGTVYEIVPEGEGVDLPDPTGSESPTETSEGST